ncbi:MAG: hypothetical protein GY795_35085 [Desulfobacterales bacterium]|nr:hypothetical protein [Desulfobacterales bacterium]
MCGLFDGESLERLWSMICQAAKAMKEMTQV